MEVLPTRVDTQTKAQEKTISLNSLKSKKSFSMEILPTRIDTQTSMQKQPETVESMVIKNQFYAKKFVVEELKIKDSP